MHAGASQTVQGPDAEGASDRRAAKIEVVLLSSLHPDGQLHRDRIGTSSAAVRTAWSEAIAPAQPSVVVHVAGMADDSFEL